MDTKGGGTNLSTHREKKTGFVLQSGILISNKEINGLRYDLAMETEQEKIESRARSHFWNKDLIQ